MDLEGAQGTGTRSVSVIIPVYQGETTIGPCLDSVLAASWQDFEIIVIDDGSSDSTAEIVRSCSVRLLQIPCNGGPAAARNAGAFAAEGQFLYFLDADILMESDTLARTMRAFAERPEVCAVFGSFGAARDLQDHCEAAKDNHGGSQPGVAC